VHDGDQSATTHVGCRGVAIFKAFCCESGPFGLDFLECFFYCCFYLFFTCAPLELLIKYKMQVILAELCRLPATMAIKDPKVKRIFQISEMFDKQAILSGQISIQLNAIRINLPPLAFFLIAVAFS